MVLSQSWLCLQLTTPPNLTGSCPSLLMDKLMKVAAGMLCLLMS